MPDLNQLHTIPLFRELADNELTELLTMMEEHEYPKGTDIVRMGEAGDTFYIIQRGEVQVGLRDGDGRYVPLDRLDAGEFFGELAMLTGEARQASATAISAVQTLELDRAAFYTFLKAHPNSAVRFMVVLARRLRDTEQLLQYQVSESPAKDESRASLGQRIADRIADFSGSLQFLAANAILFAVWIILNLPHSPFEFDPFPFGFLTMSVSLEAIFLSIFVLISQNRQASKDRVKAEQDYRVNLKAELEIGILLRDLREVQDRLEVMQHDQAVFHSLVANGNRADHSAAITRPPV